MPKLRTPWRAVSAVFILTGWFFGVLASRIPALADKHDLSHGALGTMLLLPVLGAILAFPYSGKLADKLGAVRVTQTLAIGATTSLMLLAFAPNLATFGFALFLFGGFQGGTDVTMNVWAGEVEKSMKRPVMSSFHAMFSVGTGLGAGSGFLAASLGQSVSVHFVLAALCMAAIVFPMTKVGWVSETNSAAEKAPIIAIPKGGLFLVGFMTFCAAIGEGALADWSAIFLIELSHVTEAKAALGYAVFSAAMVITRLLGDRIIASLGPVLTARLAGAVATVGVFLAVMLPTYETALVGFALMGVGYSVVFPLAFSRAASDPSMAPGAAIASVATLGYGGALLGPPLIGFISEMSSLRMGFIVLGCLAFAISVVAFSLRRDT
ncbi:MAG: MFS transporter [Thalassovita sp.]